MAKRMTASDFRRIALSLEGAEEGSHMGAVDFRVGGHIFATLASQHLGYGNLMITPEVQAQFVAEQPDIFAEEEPADKAAEAPRTRARN